MEKKILKGIMFFLIFFCAAVNIILYFSPEIRGVIEEKHMEKVQQEEQKARVLKAEKGAAIYELKLIPYRIKQAEVEKKEKFDENNQLKISLPKGTQKKKIKVEKEPLASVIKVIIPNAGKYYFANTPVKGRNKHMIEISYEMKKKSAVIIMKFDQVMEIKTESNGYFLYLSFLTPKEQYDKVVVIDPGHGGKNIGEQAGGCKEKDINLAVALKLRKLLEEQNIGVYCTRDEDINPTQTARVALAQTAQADYFISIHCNIMKNEKFYYITGAEAFYQKEKKKSQNLAKSCIKNMVQQCGMVNRGIQKEQEGTFLAKVNIPAVLLKVGFLSNEDEKKSLMSEEYQRHIAQGICDALVQNIQENEKKGKE